MTSPEPLTMHGTSRALQHMLDLCMRVAGTRSTVLITGETGVGKELVARFIHRHSPRRDRPMIICNCHGVPETLLESELFGHERGAFTGAIQSRSGLFERSNGGTLLLDEVGEIPLPAQAKMLRVLQERRFQRLGSAATMETDVRVIATTHHDLRSLSQHGKFREDLFFRLNVFPVHVPALRERREDIAALANWLLADAARHNRCRQSGFSETAMALLVSFDWPGNVRQLQSVIERALLLSGGDPISEQHPPPEITAGFLPPESGETATSLSYAQRLLIARALHEAAWNLTRAAARLGVTVHTLRQLMATLRIQRTEG
ncbi:MAG: sigma-54-dependent Fis family transcriptional regulator [Planctomycetes bacterium]|nr:sigma-54-dependent Fis family transcriptional regulator [Planctomycetota bacterium]